VYRCTFFLCLHFGVQVYRCTFCVYILVYRCTGVHFVFTFCVPLSVAYGYMCYGVQVYILCSHFVFTGYRCTFCVYIL
jgi:hypothetical protein